VAVLLCAVLAAPALVCCRSNILIDSHLALTLVSCYHHVPGRGRLRVGEQAGGHVQGRAVVQRAQQRLQAGKQDLGSQNQFLLLLPVDPLRCPALPLSAWFGFLLLLL
jgi:hypothetical protein